MQIYLKTRFIEQIGIMYVSSAKKAVLFSAVICIIVRNQLKLLQWGAVIHVIYL